MATIVKLSDKKFVVTNGVIWVSEREVPFDTSFEVISPKTGVQKRFHFNGSTGSVLLREFDPKTELIYKSEDGFEFRVCNDKRMTELAAANYLNHKLRK